MFSPDDKVDIKAFNMQMTSAKVGTEYKVTHESQEPLEVDDGHMDMRFRVEEFIDKFVKDMPSDKNTVTVSEVKDYADSIDLIIDSDQTLKLMTEVLQTKLKLIRSIPAAELKVVPTGLMNYLSGFR